MKTIRKAIILSISLVCCLILISFIIIFPSFISENAFYKDRKLRAELAGNLDFLVIGASHGLNAYDSRILDKKLGCNSYNLSGSMMSLYGKYCLLDKELERNPINTVVIELSYDTLTRDQRDDFSGGDTQVIERLDSFSEVLSYVLNYIPFDDWLNIYSRLMRNGIIDWEHKLLGKSGGTVDKSLKGFHSVSTNNVTLTEHEILNKYNKTKLYREVDPNNLSFFNRILDLCTQNHVRTIITVVPLSDARILEGSNWDEFYQWVKAFAEKYDYEFYDFNLQKNRYELYDDEKSFYDVQHLSAIGANAFTNAFCDILLSVDRGEDVSDRFYSSYSDMKLDSPYMKYLT